MTKNPRTHQLVKALFLAAFVWTSGVGRAQTLPPTQPIQLTPEERRMIEEKRRQEAADKARMEDSLTNGLLVRLGDLGGFRGAQSNTILGYGLVVGLAGTGDSRQTPFTAKLLANALSRFGTMVKPEDLQGKNIAAVTVTAQLPPFAAPGRKVSLTVSSIGDAKSLQGGFLLPTPLSPANQPEKTYVMGAGPLSLGGFSASAGGSGVSRNHQTVARIPDGGDIQQTVPTQIVFEGGRAFFDLDVPDFTTAKRAAAEINQKVQNVRATAVDAVTLMLDIQDASLNPVTLFSQIESVEVRADLPASVVINERTGTIVVGGNVKLGPAVIAHGSLQVRIQTDVLVSQPAPLSQGQTAVVEVPNVEAGEEPTQVALIPGSATLDDLARILQTLEVSARDIIAIFQALADQGALKARIRIQ
ncbi:MAG: flagellar basal body P-ring protein FlgI [Fimbriimonadaceae bacterium]|nr:flagellar basal body P-ring protein FlgI [Fimbriimonadaceae bacterium]